MDIIRMEGGLGNQLFQYALYRQLQKMGRKVKMDTMTEYGRGTDRQHMLWVFRTSYEEATKEEINELTDGFMDTLSRIKRKLRGRKSKEYHEISGNFDPQVFNKTPVYLTGYFQSERYFKDLSQELREELVFTEKIWKDVSTELRKQIEEYNEEILHSEAVSIHVRRGDYLQHPEIYGVSCTLAYYKAAIAYIKKYHPNARFFVFTNETDWTKQWFAEHFEEEITFIEGTTEETGYLDLMLMSRCRHHIMANSSFSWWGSWLNKQEGQITIAPSKWLGNQECQDIYTSDMIRITPDGRLAENEKGTLE